MQGAHSSRVKKSINFIIYYFQNVIAPSEQCRLKGTSRVRLVHITAQEPSVRSWCSCLCSCLCWVFGIFWNVGSMTSANVDVKLCAWNLVSKTAEKALQRSSGQEAMNRACSKGNCLNIRRGKNGSQEQLNIREGWPEKSVFTHWKN